MCQPLTNDITKMEKQRHDMDVVHFLIPFKSEYEPVRECGMLFGVGRC
jgi:hypothetical protein